MTPHRPSAVRAVRALPLAVAALLLIVASATVVLAGEEALGGKLRSGETIVIAAGETVGGDLYAFGESVTVDGTVDGDLVAAGGNIFVNGTITGDLIAAGGSVTVAGSVEGDARVASGQLLVSGDVGEDLLIAAGTASLSTSGTVGEDLIVGAGQLSLAGTVAGSVEGGAGSYQRTGAVGGTDNVVVGEADEEPQAETPIEDRVVATIRHFVVVILLGALALWLVPRLVTVPAELIRRRPLAAVGFGLLAALGWLIGIICVLILIILTGVLLGLIGFGELIAIIVVAAILAVLVASFAIWIVTAYLADAIVGLALAGFARRASGSRWADLGLLVAGAAVVVLVTSLPVVGGLFKLVVAIIGLGALALAAWERWRARRAPVTVETAWTPPPQEPA